MKEQLIWIVVFVIAVIFELVTMQIVSVWFAVAAIAALIASFFLPFGFQLGIFVVLSVLLFIASRPLVKKLSHPAIPTNLDREIGNKALVIEDINLKENTGRVRLNGVDWKAYSFDGSVIKSGEPVTVREISGAHLIIERCALLDDPDNENSDIWRKYNDL